MKKMVILLLLAGLFPPSAIADVCNYRPSKIIGETGAATAASGTGAVAATGVAMKAAGLYAFPHAAGAMMLGSTAAGTSAAGTIGIIANTAGLLGSVGAALMSPVVIIPAAIAAVGIGAYEGVCHLSDK